MNLLILILATIISNPSLMVKSTAFANNNYIPLKYTCDGPNVNHALVIEDIPKNSKSLVVIMDDTDSPNGEFTHWLMWNIPPKKHIVENSAPGIQGVNSMLQNKYYGPCPPNGMHKYNFKVYALDIIIDLPKTADKKALLTAIEGHVLSKGVLIGSYYRQ
jgi:Raf kinase inhibitor-like YbhB/YbcL family protein